MTHLLDLADMPLGQRILRISVASFSLHRTGTEGVSLSAIPVLPSRNLGCTDAGA